MLQKNFTQSSTVFLMVALLIASCDYLNPKSEILPKQDADEILKADIAFSDMSRQLGMKKAFIEYISDEGVLLRPDNLPIVGADAIDFLSQLNDTAYTLTWKSSKSDISKSGELGYTSGIYELTTADTLLKGTYINVWKKQNDGAWKFVVDSRNQGISSNQP